jgi:hypothetical protein
MTLRRLGNNVTLMCWDSKQVLYSYDTPVCAWVLGHGYYRTTQYFSPTTSKHITRWLDGRKAELVDQSFIDNLCR